MPEHEEDPAAQVWPAKWDRARMWGERLATLAILAAITVAAVAAGIWLAHYLLPP